MLARSGQSYHPNRASPRGHSPNQQIVSAIQTKPTLNAPLPEIPPVHALSGIAQASAAVATPQSNINPTSISQPYLSSPQQLNTHEVPSRHPTNPTLIQQQLNSASTRASSVPSSALTPGTFLIPAHQVSVPIGQSNLSDAMKEVSAFEHAIFEKV